MVSADAHRTALLVVDMQPDFMEGGALATDAGSRAIEPVRRLMERGSFGLIAGTQDWHPAGHVSFASSHDGGEPFSTIELHGHDQVLWPDHCVQGTAGAQLHPDLPWDRASVIIRKGEDPAVDSYSGFRNNFNRDGQRPPTGLAGYLRERGIEHVVLCGLAREVCVLWTAQDAVDAGFRVTFVWDATRPVDPSTDDDTGRSLNTAGIAIADTGALVR